MRYLFLGGMYPPQLRGKILIESKRGFQSAADTLQNALIEGLGSHNENLNVLTAPFISSFPFGSNFLFFKGLDYRCNSKINGKCISFINLPILKEFLIGYTLSDELYKWSKLDTKKKCLIVYSLQAYLLKAAIKAKMNDPNIIICLIIPDLPEFMNWNRIYTILGLKKKYTKYIYNNLKKSDYYVLLSKSMINKLELEEKKCLILEGLYSQIDIIKSTKIDNKNKIILYTGSLDKKYGIDNLLKAFNTIKNKNYRLWICGDGFMKKEIQLLQSKDKRVFYYGLLPREEILIMQKKATVLINPRLPEGDYTFFSFPSKTMEYLASGTPTIMYKLGGIPCEYFKYCFVPKDFTIDSLKEQIINVCEKNKNERVKFGRDAALFIKKYKNPSFQTQKIINMIESFAQ